MVVRTCSLGTQEAEADGFMWIFLWVSISLWNIAQWSKTSSASDLQSIQDFVVWVPVSKQCLIACAAMCQWTLEDDFWFLSSTVKIWRTEFRLSGSAVIVFTGWAVLALCLLLFGMYPVMDLLEKVPSLYQVNLINQEMFGPLLTFLLPLPLPLQILSLQMSACSDKQVLSPSFTFDRPLAIPPFSLPPVYYSHFSVTTTAAMIELPTLTCIMASVY